MKIRQPERRQAPHRQLFLMILLSSVVAFACGVTYGIHLAEVNMRTVQEAMR